MHTNNTYKLTVEFDGNKAKRVTKEHDDIQIDHHTKSDITKFVLFRFLTRSVALYIDHWTVNNSSCSVAMLQYIHWATNKSRNTETLT